MSGELSVHLRTKRVERLEVEKRIRCELRCNSRYRTALELHNASDRELLAVSGIGPVALAKIRAAIDRLLDGNVSVADPTTMVPTARAMIERELV